MHWKKKKHPCGIGTTSKEGENMNGSLDVREIVDIVAQSEYNTALIDAVRSICENVYLTANDQVQAISGIVKAKGENND